MLALGRPSPTADNVLYEFELLISWLSSFDNNDNGLIIIIDEELKCARSSGTGCDGMSTDRDTLQGNPCSTTDGLSLDECYYHR